MLHKGGHIHIQPEPRPLKRRSSWPRQLSGAPRPIRIVLRSLLLLITILGLRRGFADLHDQLVKREATDFTTLLHHNVTLVHPKHYNRILSGSHIGSRYAYLRHLGSGDEGSADLYQDLESNTTVVIKTVDGFLRNHIPDAIRSDFSQYTSLWPTEIEAALILTQTHPNLSLLLLSDYFVLQREASWSWATVSEFSSRGTLKSFVKTIERQDMTIEQLDRRFRPQFDKLLTALEALHRSGMCHDDVKPDNVFVRDPSEWLLGDMGNIRQLQHPWHSTRSWSRQNQLKDCRSNDVRRLIKSYLSFLRSASDVTTFDEQFWRAETAWSRLYWDFASALGQSPRHDLFAFTESVHTRTERELLCTTITWKLWRPHWFLTFWL